MYTPHIIHIKEYQMIYGSIRVHTGPYGPIFVARGEKNQVKKVKINISDRDFFLGLVQGDVTNCCGQLFYQIYW